MKSSGSLPAARASSATERCSSSARADWMTCTLSHSPLNRRKCAGLAISLRRASRNCFSRSLLLKRSPFNGERRLPRLQPFEHVGRVQREVHRERAARHRADQPAAALVGFLDFLQVVEYGVADWCCCEAARRSPPGAATSAASSSRKPIARVAALGEHEHAAPGFAAGSRPARAAPPRRRGARASACRLRRCARARCWSRSRSRRRACLPARGPSSQRSRPAVAARSVAASPIT